MFTDEVIITAIVGTILFLILVVLIFGITGLYLRRRIHYIKEKAALQFSYEQAILQAQIEVQNQTLQRIGQDLHDNIGQLLTLTRLYLNVAEDLIVEGEARQQIIQANDILNQSITEVRALTKSLDSDFIKDFGLVEGLTHELKRLEKTGRFYTQLNVSGDTYLLGFQREIIFFRVTQELLNNTIKHSGASSISISIEYGHNEFVITITDNGKGFDYDATINQHMEASGAGLRNIRHRIELIGGTCIFCSGPAVGTTVKLSVPSISH